jgi:penicillin amidase
MRILRFLLALALVVLLGGGSVVRFGPLPRLGPFLDPSRGAWALLQTAEWQPSERVAIPGLSAPVEVRLDDRGVPHIFAANEFDAYRVQGWIAARERLFQMELTTRATAGTLSELLGKQLLEADQESRAIGLAWAADRKYAALDTASLGYRAVAAYAEGVNAWIDELKPRKYPLEYRLLDAKPSRWEPKHSLYLFAQMGLTLAYGDPAETKLRVQALVGAEAAEALVAVNSVVQEPIQPSSHAPRFALTPLPAPGLPDSAAIVALSYVPASVRPYVRAEEGIELGSNNWAVAPSRTRAGYALLAGDPHLELTLPSIWYEAHIVVPGELDVAGVTLPGSPGIVIGFNRDVAWTFTNTGGDVFDVYTETVDDSLSPKQYRLDGAWKPIETREEVYRDGKGNVIATDTVRFTHRGPMRKQGNGWTSFRWTALEPSRETDLFLKAARATTADEWLEVMRAYVAPTQNGLVADRQGSIGIRSAGWYPIRPNGGRGDQVFDGSTTASDWTGMLPVERYPQALRPAQGFLVSANQQPVDPAENDAYLGADWPSPWRAMQINSLLRADSALTPDAMRVMHRYPGSVREAQFRPWYIRGATAEIAAGRGRPRLERALKLLAEWDGKYTPDNERAILFELAQRELPRKLWDELIPPGEKSPIPRGSQPTLRAMLDSVGPWWDDRRTPDVRETRNAILAAALEAALDSAIAQYGEPEAGGWKWSAVWPTDIWHLLRLPGLSAPNIAVQGGPETIAPAGRHGTTGASWRMVVELGPEVRAWGTYPGGQSGNPASMWYANRIPQWASGGLDTLLIPKDAADLPATRTHSKVSFAVRGQ